MGTITDAYCDHCGFKKSVHIGGSMANFREFLAWPVYCKSCDDLSIANLRNSPLSCEECKSTDVVKYDGGLVIGGRRTVEMCFSDTLTDGDYFCPRCKEYHLKYGTGKGGSHILFD